MARKSLRPQLNQIRAWVRQGRTEAWIAHQLEVSSSQLRDFIKRNGLEEGDEPANDVDLRDEIEAEIEAELDEEPEDDEPEDDELEDEELEEEDDEEEDEPEVRAGRDDLPGGPAMRSEQADRPDRRDRPDRPDRRDRPDSADRPDREEGSTDEGSGSNGDGEPRRRRRRRRGGRGRGRGRRREIEAAFDHGDKDGYGLWLDPSVKDDPIYAQHWAGERKLKVTFEEDKIVLERAGSNDN